MGWRRYFDGKTRAEDAIAKSFPSTGTLIQPTFIYGGDAFELTPPRVSDAYGAGIDALLSSSPIRAIAGISPGLIKVILGAVGIARSFREISPPWPQYTSKLPR